MSYTADKTAYNAAINDDISTQTGANTIPPEVVGAGYTDLADLLEPYINAINNQAILSGSSAPSPLIGADLDLYYRSQPTYFELYRKEAGTWFLKVNVPFSVTLPEGNLTVQTSIDGLNVIATKGGWVIANTVYSKATQTGITVAAADLNFYRHDIIYADTLNNIQYLQGTASASPVTPSLPANTILIDEVVVPASSSGFDPYLLYGATIENETTPIRSDTGALTYEGITIASGTTVNIGACTGYVVDNETVPGESSFLFVNYAGETAKTVTTLGSGIATYVLLSGSGTIVFQNTFPTSAQRKTHIYLSKISHPAGTITVAADEPDFVLSPLAQFRDLFQALNYVNDGVYPSANGANLTFNVSAGNIHGNGINFVNDNTNPNELAVVPSTPATFLPRTRTGAGGAATTTIDVGNYDVAGAVTAIPGGANTSTLRYIFIVPGLGYIVQYGQTAYASLVDAIAAVGKESSFVVYPSLTNNSLLIGVLAATKSATALNDTAQAQFFRADKFGQIIGAQAGVSIGTLQSSYNNSLQPQITTTTALGAVQIKRGSAADTDNVFQVLNAAGTANFSVTGNGLATLKAGGEALKVGTNTGLNNFAYLGIYPREAAPTTIGTKFGYISAATTTLTIDNALGQVYISSGVTNSAITLAVNGSGSIITANASLFSVTPSTGATQGWVNNLGVSPAITSSNVLQMTTGLSLLSNGSRVMLRTHSGGTTATATASSNKIGEYSFGGYSGSAYYDAAKILGSATELYTSTAGGSKLDFYTTPNGTITQQLAMTIGQDGNVGIGNSGPTEKLHLAGSLRINGGNLQTSGSGFNTAFIVSAGRLTTNANGLATINSFLDGQSIEVSVGSSAPTGIVFEGLTAPSDDSTIKLFTNGTEKARVAKNGNVGIGITPIEKLHVEGNGLFDGTASLVPSIILNANGAASNNQYVDFRTNNNSKFQVGYTQVAGINKFFIYNSIIPGNALSILESNNYIGIDITPTEKLHVNGNGLFTGTLTSNNPMIIDNLIGTNVYTHYKISGSPIAIIGSEGAIFGSNPNNFGIYTYGSDDFFIATSGIKRIIVTGTGNVGIGITPTEKLHVGGNGLFTGSVTADVHLAQTGIVSNGNLGVAAEATIGTYVRLLATSTPAGSIAAVFGENIAGVDEVRVKDSAGNVTTISPHNFELIPGGPSEELAWAYHSERDGKKINVDMLKLARLVETLTGEKIVYTN